MVRKPRVFQRGNQLSIPFRRYSESVNSSTAHERVSAFSASIAAIISIRLLVVKRALPDICFSSSRYLRTAAQPPGPGFPRQAPSVKIVTCGIAIAAFFPSADIERAAAVHEERHPSDEIGLFGGEEQCRIGHVPRGPHLMAQRDSGIAFRRDLDAALPAHPGARVDRHRRVYQTRQDHVGTNTILRILDRYLLGK